MYDIRDTQTILITFLLRKTNNLGSCGYVDAGKAEVQAEQDLVTCSIWS